MGFPRIHLALDNCFASKRWTQPSEWMSIAADLGIRCVEASADNECDPLYADSAYLQDWLAACKAASGETGVRVANLYSGHGTYATLGLGGTDPRNRDHIQHNWAEVMIRNAGELGAGLGFYCHAFCHSVLQDPKAYRAAEQDLCDRLAELAACAASCGLPTIGVEQMYTPHQIPWTIKGAKRLMKEVLSRGGKPMYLSLDTGHQIGQRKFLRPSEAELSNALEESRQGRLTKTPWLGRDATHELFQKAARSTSTADRKASVRAIVAEMDQCPYLFAEDKDGDLYAWITELGRYCPIFHLQQTDGACSAHWAFTEANNARGIVRGQAVLQALSAGCQSAEEPEMPPACEAIYLTIEVFPAVTDTAAEILADLKESVAYWRQFIPEDGRTLDQLAP